MWGPQGGWDEIFERVGWSRSRDCEWEGLGYGLVQTEPPPLDFALGLAYGGVRGPMGGGDIVVS